MSRIGKSTETENKLVVARVTCRGTWGVISNVCGVCQGQLKYSKIRQW